MDQSKLHIVAIVGIVEKNGKVLLLKRAPHEIAFPNQYTLPGGKLERGSNVTETLKREMEEEAGIKIGDPIIYICDRTFVRPDDIHVVSFTYRCPYLSGEVKISKDFTDYIWAAKEDLGKLDVIDGVKQNLLHYFFK